jgi:hypothetical protein
MAYTQTTSYTGQTAQTLGLDPEMLTKIITATHQSSADMTQLNNSLYGTGQNLDAHMQSEAGTILWNKLNTWNDDYTKIKMALDALNHRATDMRAALIAANQLAAQTGQGGFQ